MSTSDPYHDRRVYHFASRLNARGEVSALCFSKPRSIDMSRAAWTNRAEAVTCRQCKRLLNGQTTPAEERHG